MTECQDLFQIANNPQTPLYRLTSNPSSNCSSKPNIPQHRRSLDSLRSPLFAISSSNPLDSILDPGTLTTFPPLSRMKFTLVNFSNFLNSSSASFTLVFYPMLYLLSIYAYSTFSLKCIRTTSAPYEQVFLVIISSCYISPCLCMYIITPVLKRSTSV